MANRSYFEEIRELENTWDAIESDDIIISPQVTADFFAGKAYCIGAGGSLVLAKLWQLVFDSNRLGIAKTMSPYEFNQTKTVPDIVFLFSASGKSHDIIQAFKSAIAKDCKVVVFTVTKNSALMRLVKTVNNQAVVIYPKTTVRKDGFLAVNSVIAIAGLIAHLQYTIFGHEKSIGSPVSMAIHDHQKSRVSFPEIRKDMIFQIITSEWGEPAGNDLETRLAESGIGSCFLTDPRNFAHGRFIWLEENNDSLMILFGTPSSERFIKRFIRVLPGSLPVYYVSSSLDGLYGAIYCLTRSILFFSELAKVKGIDPGKPVVPDWGRKLHSLRLGKNDLSVQGNHEQLNPSKKNYPALRSNFAGAVVDIDGTLLDGKDRMSLSINSNLRKELNRLLREGLLLAFATGRGKSALRLLEGAILEEFWDQVLVGLYNGTYILKLSEAIDFDKSKIPSAFKEGLVSRIKKVCDFVLEDKVDVGPTQITVEGINKRQCDCLAQKISRGLGQGIRFIRMVYSDHSLDILPDWASKLRVIVEMDIYPDKDIICIGDQGQLGGNDEELLSWKPSVSVGKFRPVSNACLWLGREGKLRGTAGTIALLKAITPVNGGFAIDRGALGIDLDLKG